MKVRVGFVSNSSTSSYICDICKEVSAGRDLSIKDAGMCCCVKGHVFCEEHALYPHHDFYKYFEEINEEKLKDVINCLKRLFPASFILEKFGGDDFSKESVSALLEHYNINIQEFLPSRFCPICMLKKIPDSELLNFMLKEYNLKKKDVAKRIEKEFKTYKEFKEYIGEKIKNEKT